MEYQSSSFVAMPVYSLEDGEQIGTVKDVVIDNKALEVCALVIEPKGIFKEQKIIPYLKVRNVGNDAITIERSNGATNPTNLPNILSLMKGNQTVIGAKVVTETGVVLGYVDEYLVEDTTGKIVAFQLGSKLSGLLNGKSRLDSSWALRLGKDALIVKAGAEEAQVFTSPPMKDNLKSMSEVASKWLDNTFDQTKKWSKSFSEKISKIASEEMPARFRKKDEEFDEFDLPKEDSEEQEQKEDKNPPPSDDLF